jgi:hypothetical protein
LPPGARLGEVDGWRSERRVKPAEVRRWTRLCVAWKGVGEAVTKEQNLMVRREEKGEPHRVASARCAEAYLTASTGGGGGSFMLVGVVSMWEMADELSYQGSNAASIVMVRVRCTASSAISDILRQAVSSSLPYTRASRAPRSAGRMLCQCDMKSQSQMLQTCRRPKIAQRLHRKPPPPPKPPSPRSMPPPWPPSLPPFPPFSLRAPLPSLPAPRRPRS